MTLSNQEKHMAVGRLMTGQSASLLSAQFCMARTTRVHPVQAGLFATGCMLCLMCLLPPLRRAVVDDVLPPSFVQRLDGGERGERVGYRGGGGVCSCLFGGATAAASVACAVVLGWPVVVMVCECVGVGGACSPSAVLTWLQHKVPMCAY